MKDLIMIIIFFVLLFADCKRNPFIPDADLTWENFKEKGVRDTEGYPDLVMFSVEKKCEGVEGYYVLANSHFKIGYYELVKDQRQMSTKYWVQIKTKSGDFEEILVSFENANLIARFLSDSIRIAGAIPRKYNGIVETNISNDSLAVRILLDNKNSLLNWCPLYLNCP